MSVVNICIKCGRTTCEKSMNIVDLVMRPILRKLDHGFIARNHDSLARIKKILELVGYRNSNVIKYSKQLNFAFKGCPEAARYLGIAFKPHRFGNEGVCIIDSEHVSVAYLPTQSGIDVSAVKLSEYEIGLTKDLGSRMALASTFDLPGLVQLDMKDNFPELAEDHFMRALAGIEEALELDILGQRERVQRLIKHTTLHEIGLLVQNKLKIKKDTNSESELVHALDIWHLFIDFCANAVLRTAGLDDMTESYHEKADAMVDELAQKYTFREPWIRGAHMELRDLRRIARLLCDHDPAVIRAISELAVYEETQESDPLQKIKLAVLRLLFIVARRYVVLQHMKTVNSRFPWVESAPAVFISLPYMSTDKRSDHETLAYEISKRLNLIFRLNPVFAYDVHIGDMNLDLDKVPTMIDLSRALIAFIPKNTVCPNGQEKEMTNVFNEIKMAYATGKRCFVAVEEGAKIPHFLNGGELEHFSYSKGTIPDLGDNLILWISKHKIADLR
jgi:hypothetical protein